MKMAALQLMQHKATKDAKTEALTGSTAADDACDDKPAAAAAEISEKTAKPTTDSVVLSESRPTLEDKSESQHPSATENSAITVNGTHDPTVPEIQNGCCDSPLEGKETLKTGLARAKALTESLATEDGSGIGMFKKQLNACHVKRGAVDRGVLGT